MTQTIADGAVVAFHYTLTVDGTPVDSSEGKAPLCYLHGARNIVPGLERELAGKAPGDVFRAIVPPAEGYGEGARGAAQRVPRDAFPEDAHLVVGASFMAQDADGERARFFVVGLDGDDVLIGSGHPLAGKTLCFDVEVVSIRAASAEELAHGHPHGPGGSTH